MSAAPTEGATTLSTPVEWTPLKPLAWSSLELTLSNMSIVCANRDAERFDDAERLDITRNPNSHLTFGHGLHHCVGAALARMEGRVALARLLERSIGSSFR